MPDISVKPRRTGENSAPVARAYRPPMAMGTTLAE